MAAIMAELEQKESDEINTRGNKITRGFVFCGERYFFDFEYCKPSNGWKQFDTDQDAWYFGMWVNPVKLQTITYAEGDIIIVDCPDVEHYNAEIEDAIKFYGEGYEFKAIDMEEKTCTTYRQDRTMFLIEV